MVIIVSVIVNLCLIGYFLVVVNTMRRKITALEVELEQKANFLPPLVEKNHPQLRHTPIPEPLNWHTIDKDVL